LASRLPSAVEMPSQNEKIVEAEVHMLNLIRELILLKDEITDFSLVNYNRG
jgi:hypothetical protein